MLKPVPMPNDVIIARKFRSMDFLSQYNLIKYLLLDKLEFIVPETVSCRPYQQAVSHPRTSDGHNGP